MENNRICCRADEGPTDIQSYCCDSCGMVDEIAWLGNKIKCHCTNVLAVDFSSYGAEKLAEWFLSLGYHRATSSVELVEALELANKFISNLNPDGEQTYPYHELSDVLFSIEQALARFKGVKS